MKKMSQDKFKEILEDCFMCRTTTHEYHLEYERALKEILNWFKEEIVPKKKNIKNLVNTQDEFYKNGIMLGYNQAIDDIHNRLEESK